jgi:integrase
MADRRITKRVVDSLKVLPREYTVWDAKMPGFGVRVRPTGAKSYIVVYRAGHGRGAPVRRLTIANVGKTAPEAARRRAKAILGEVAHGRDPAGERTSERGMSTVAELADRFLAEHVEPKRKAGTAAFYRDILERIVKPELGSAKADKVTRVQVAKLHGKLRATPFQANRLLAVVGSMYSFAGRIGAVPEGTNPARRIDKFSEHRRERFLTVDELGRLGAAMRQAETKGVPWEVDEGKPKAKHLPKARNRFTKVGPFAAAALRLLLFTGCRLREILHLKWEHVDFERGLLFLPDSKTGKKTVILNAPALEVLAGLDRVGPYVVPGDDPGKPRADLKRPWEGVSKRAGLNGVRLHDLRHTYASFGAGGGLGLPIIGKLLGHSHAATTARYAHLDNDPLRRASEHIGGRIVAALAGRKGGAVMPLRRIRRQGPRLGKAGEMVRRLGGCQAPRTAAHRPPTHTRDWAEVAQKFFFAQLLIQHPASKFRREPVRSDAIRRCQNELARNKTKQGAARRRSGCILWVLRVNVCEAAAVRGRPDLYQTRQAGRLRSDGFGCLARGPSSKFDL